MAEAIPWRIGSAVLQKDELIDLSYRKERSIRTTFELTTPLIFPLGRRKARPGNRNEAVLRTHKLMTIASETLRLYEPSTLFDTHALGEGCHYVYRGALDENSQRISCIACQVS